jgi:hypothetical protein
VEEMESTAAAMAALPPASLVPNAPVLTTLGFSFSNLVEQDEGQ